MAYLILEDGTIFEGTAFGKQAETIGEVVFNTGMTGYESVLTDPSYYGQIVAMTYPLIGNYGINTGDMESSKSYVKGFIVRELCKMPSNWASEGTLDDFLTKYNICGIEGIDTRALTRKIREKGTMRGIIKLTAPTEEDFKKLNSYKINNPVKEVSTQKTYFVKGRETASVAVIDYGLKLEILHTLSKRGYDVTVYPSSVSANEILNANHDGVFLTNGPGDPNDNTYEIAEIKKLIGKKPIFGVCLGHQLLAIAHGGKTEKLKYGHRGANQPVKDLESGKVYITTQNHGYCVIADGLQRAEVTHVNWNDMTCEGLKYLDTDSFGVQFYPGATTKPSDTGYLFEKFEELMRKVKFK